MQDARLKKPPIQPGEIITSNRAASSGSDKSLLDPSNLARIQGLSFLVFGMAQDVVPQRPIGQFQ